MKICIPIIEDRGFDSAVNPHFGSAPAFFIYDTVHKTYTVASNGDHDHQHGMCQPVAAIQGLEIDVVVCAGMGFRAVQRLNQAGVRVYRIQKESVGEVIKEFDLDTLSELTDEQACTEHECR